MNYPYGLLAEHWHWGATLLYALALIMTLFKAPWYKLKPGHLTHVYLGSCVSLLLLWSIKSDAIPGLEYHYLGAMLLTLMFGWQLAFIALSIVLIGLVINGSSDWQTYPLNALLLGLFPTLLSHTIHRLVERYLPHHFFIYIFANAFFGAALVLLGTIMLTTLILLTGEIYNWQKLTQLYLSFIPLMIFPEAFITGFLITVMVVMRPGWVLSFDDRRYLIGK